jgi:NADPH-ferrihemoprotein reductase
MATYGEGDPTDNSQEFFEWLKESSTNLSSLCYTVFALGNKTYEHYNMMGRFVDEQLEKLGAERIYKRGEGDDDANIEEDFVTWKEGLLQIIVEYFKIDASQATHVGREYELTIHTDLQPQEIYIGEPHRLGSYETQKIPFNTKNPYLASVTVNKELHTGGDRSCMHIELDITGSKLSYVAGDHLAVFPSNELRQVDRIGELLGVDLDTVFSLTNVDEEATKAHPFPCPTSYRTALTHYVDINSVLRTHVLKELVDHASDPKDKEFIIQLTSPKEEGKQLYNNWMLQAHRNLLAVLEDLPSFRPPLDYLLELLPRLQVRYYSISSSPKLYPNSVHITAVLVQYSTSTGRTINGVASTWLKSLVPDGDKCLKVPIYIRHSSLRLPFRPVNPVIMVGPGTGLAPFRGFIQERSTAITEKRTLGPTVLFFGCRHRDQDYIYQDELEDFRDKKVLSDLQVAFSRDQPEKVYVQHKLLEQADSVWELLENQGYFYVCGDARNMARDVQSVLITIIKEKGSKTDSEAAEYIKKLQKRGRYLQDVWS